MNFLKSFALMIIIFFVFKITSRFNCDYLIDKIIDTKNSNPLCFHSHKLISRKSFLPNWIVIINLRINKIEK